MASGSLAFAARRSEPVLVAPSKATPRERKPLSDIDDQESLRFYRSVVYFFRRGPAANATATATATADSSTSTSTTKDLVGVLKSALADVLVFYYPIAGRIREEAGRKLVVDSTGEGVVFVEASADVRLDDFGSTLTPPIPCTGELLCLPESSSATVVDRPLLYIQVTRLACGGFVFGLQICHCLADAPGVAQFMTALGELVRGAAAPSVRPVWARELLAARSPPRAAYEHPEYEAVADPGNDRISPGDVMLHRPFFFGTAAISALREAAPPHLRNGCSRFDLVAAFVWRCRTAALGYDSSDEVRFQCVVNARGKLRPPLPEGFYGNALTFGTAVTTAGELYEKPYGYALELVRKAKERVMVDDYLQSAADVLVAKGRPRFTTARTYLVTDLTKSRLHDIDLGWGTAVYGAPATTTLATFHMPTTNAEGEEGITVPICLPVEAMERLVAEMEWLKKKISADADADQNKKSSTAAATVFGGGVPELSLGFGVRSRL